MKLNIKKGFDIHIGGEVAKGNSLPLDYFAKICTTFQDFVNEVAKNSIPNESLDLSNFQLQITGFFKGSAVPRFSLTPKVQTVVVGSADKQKTLVSNRVDKLLSLTAKGNYAGIIDIYQAPASRNAVVNSMYSFMNAFGTAPVEFGRYNQSKRSFTTTYKAKRFSSRIKENLLIDVPKILPADKEEFHTVADITITKSANKRVTRKINQAFTTPGLIAAYKPTDIAVNGKRYMISGLLAEFFIEDGYYVLKCDLLDIVGTGDTEEEAKVSFADEIDYIYTTYLTLPDEKLSSRLLEIKRILPFIIKLRK